MNGPIKTPSNPHEHSPTILPDEPAPAADGAFTDLTLSLERTFSGLAQLLEDVVSPKLAGSGRNILAVDEEHAAPVERLYAISQAALSAKSAFIKSASQSSDPTIRLRFLGEIDFADPAFRDAAVTLLGDASRPVRTEAARRINRHLRINGDDIHLASCITDLARTLDQLPDRLETVCLALSGVASGPAEKTLELLMYHAHPGVRNYAEMALRGP